MQRARLQIMRYAVSLGFVGAALLLSLSVQARIPDAFLVFFLLAVMLAGWFGRMAAGVVAVIVSMVAVDYYFIAPYRAFVMELDELPYVLSFLLSALTSSWLASARRSAAERQRAHLDELFEQTPDAIMLVDLHDRILRVNGKFVQLFGYSADEAANRFSTEVIVPEELRADALANRKRVAGGEDVGIETVRRRKDGSTVPVSEGSPMPPSSFPPRSPKSPAASFSTCDCPA